MDDAFGPEKRSEGRHGVALQWLAAVLLCGMTFPLAAIAWRDPDDAVFFWGATAFAGLSASILAGAAFATLAERRRGEAWLASRPPRLVPGDAFDVRVRFQRATPPDGWTARLECELDHRSTGGQIVREIWSQKVDARTQAGELHAAFDTSGFSAPKLGPRERLRWYVRLSGPAGRERLFAIDA